jgi:PKD repeat protein
VDYIIVTRENQPPVSVPNGPYTGTEGVAITFSGSASYDLDGSIISYGWDFGFGDGNTGTGESPAYTYAQDGTYNVTLVVTDNKGATDTNTTTATIDDTEPTADFSATTTSGLKPLTVDFTDSSTSYDGIAAWGWDFGDGDYSSEQNPTHMYTTEGIYTVSLTVYEADGDSDTKAKVDYIIVTLENQPPVSDPNGPYTGTEGAAITFSGSGSYDPDGSIISFAWDFGFGDGNTGTGKSPAYTYAQGGTYNVTLVVIDNEGAMDTKTTTATIDDTEPTADFAGTPTSGLKPLTVDFSDSSSSYDGIAAWDWDFGDGDTSTEQNPTHVYTTEGSYTVSLTVYEADGDSDTKAKVDYINVTRENQPPVSDPNGPYTGTEGVAILFSGSGSYDPDGSIISFAWDFGFGDGNTGTGESPAYTYEQDGIYNVTLVVTDNEGVMDTNTTTATIDDTEPTADFAGTPTSGLKPLTVDFSDSSTSYDGIAAWEWDFGDGNTSTEQNPTHVYATEGAYTVSLTVYEADGDSDTKAKVDYIIVTRENQLPVSVPNGPYTGTEGAAILFCGSGSYDPDGSIISYAWDFGFGDGNTGTGESPAYTYEQDGIYTVSLVVTDNEGATDTKTTTATVADTEPTADFSATPASGLKPLTVDFADSSTSYDGITAWEWDFGDGDTSSEQNPTHVYVTEGIYTVFLTVCEADGDSDTEAKGDYIIVTRENQPPVSVPNGPYTGTEGVAITFSGSGSYDPDGSIISFAWDFGDGNTRTGESPAYTYIQNGTYNVTLVVTDNEGATNTNATTATIADAEPTADFSATPASGLKPLTVDFSDSSTSYDGIAAWEWDFGDGNTSTEQNPTHVYTSEGIYTVSLTVYEADGDSDTEAKGDYIIVTRENQPPVSDPNGPYTGTEGVAILFCGSGSYDPDGSIISFAWDFGFGDGHTGTRESPAYTYAQNGTYNVTLVVTDNEGATNTNATTATIDDTEPIANFSATTTSGLKPLTVDFSDGSTSYDGITAGGWDFGDGNTSTEQNSTHVYTAEGIYTVSLTVYEADGDSDTETKEDYINVTRENQPPVSDPNGPYTSTEGVAILFSGGGSYDPDGSIISYAWEFGDGNTSTEMNAMHTYAQNGTYNVTLVVTDNEGATDTNTTTAIIEYIEPIANLSFEINPSGINFGAVEIGIEKIVSTTITNTGNCHAKVTVTKCIMKGKTRGDTIPVSALGVNGNYVDNPVIVSRSLGCKESVTVNFSIQVPVGTLADTYTEGFTITVCQS